MNEVYQLDREFVPLCNLLKMCGVVDSGGAGKQLVATGVVEVDGQTELRKTCKIRVGQTVSGPGFTIRVEGGE
ncbi:RNA-binding S4 domain-containing protein [Laribacter hongkongensis]|uniref:RNA-binding S4 domain-containing protein n=1 Tax=Laribacter hongkongensis TaxID=168471 RepID=UPI001EFD68EB|nr:RNA-binding S4 domain-containing protein [Laribacter hongkongensis]MCG9105922.1 RNA-binding S4 domain-containing protein [Laribacter hongkongensis]